jgi:hypothetical protein
MSGAPIVIVAGTGGGGTRINKVNGADVPGDTLGPYTSAIGFDVDNTNGDVEAQTTHIADNIEEISSVQVGHTAHYGPGQITVTMS